MNIDLIYTKKLYMELERGQKNKKDVFGRKSFEPFRQKKLPISDNFLQYLWIICRPSFLRQRCQTHFDRSAPVALR